MSAITPRSQTPFGNARIGNSVSRAFSDKDSDSVCDASGNGVSKGAFPNGVWERGPGWLVAAFCVVIMTAPARADDKLVLSRIAFGSCARQDKPQPIWDAVVAAKP